MAEDKLQPQRFELKYLVEVEKALAMRDFVSSYLTLDDYSIGQPDNSYQNHSLYLDSDGLQCYWDVVNGNKNRYKLRIRYYNDDPKTPVFFEIKRRVDNAILKQRGPVRRDAVADILSGHAPDYCHLASDSPKHLAALQRFSQLMLDIRAVPKTHVAYMREAWVSQHDNSVRVTFDRKVHSSPHFANTVTTKMGESVYPFEPHVILELKFTTRMPNWFKDLVETFGLRQCGVAKYAEGVAVLGNRKVSPDGFLANIPPDRVERFLSRRKSRSSNREGDSSLFLPL